VAHSWDICLSFFRISARSRDCGKMADMPNIASVFKAEISRVCRKELRSETEQLRKALSAQRAALAGMRKRLDGLERQLKAARKSAPKASKELQDDAPNSLRFRADGLKKHRARLGLSAAEAGRLMGVSALSVYNWENGKTRPRAAQLEAIAKLRALGKREAAAILETAGAQ
jgi:DNA-binding transcriptional regulator YiaG